MLKTRWPIGSRVAHTRSFTACRNAAGEGQRLVIDEIWSKADLHIHSDHSDGLMTIPAILEYVQHKTDLSVIAITDHNTIEGARFAQSLSEMYDVEVVIGEEVSSKEGHILGLFLSEDVRSGLSAADTIREIEDQNAALKEKQLGAPKDATLPGLLTDTVASLESAIEEIRATIQKYSK